MQEPIKLVSFLQHSPHLWFNSLSAVKSVSSAYKVKLMMSWFQLLFRWNQKSQIHFLKILFIFLERGERREKERERNIKVWEKYRSVVASRNRTGDLVVHRPAFSPLNHTSRGPNRVFTKHQALTSIYVHILLFWSPFHWLSTLQYLKCCPTPQAFIACRSGSHVASLPPLSHYHPSLSQGDLLWLLI